MSRTRKRAIAALIVIVVIVVIAGLLALRIQGSETRALLGTTVVTHRILCG
jgi:hypothetical protein